MVVLFGVLLTHIGDVLHRPLGPTKMVVLIASLRDRVSVWWVVRLAHVRG